ncbi:BRE1A ligase, partial [Atractosteus spatula]|nr:BRE1A ligase [Atractosteus spatula]
MSGLKRPADPLTSGPPEKRREREREGEREVEDGGAAGGSTAVETVIKLGGVSNTVSQGEAALSFLATLASSSSEEMEAELQERVESSRALTSRLVEAYDALWATVRQLERELSQDSAVWQVVSQLNSILSKENERLQQLTDQLQQKHAHMTTESQSLSSAVQCAESRVSELQVRIEELQWDMEKIRRRENRLNTHLGEVLERVNSKGYKVCGEASSVCGTITINKRKAACSFIALTKTVSRGSRGSFIFSRLLSAVSSWLLVARLSHAHQKEHQFIQRGSVQTASREEGVMVVARGDGQTRRSVELCSRAESAVKESSEYRCLQSQFSVLYNESLQLKAQLDETRARLNTTRGARLRQLDHMENDEVSLQRKVRTEVIQLEDTLAQVRKEYEMLRIEFEQTLAANEQAGPINREMRHLISTLQNHNQQMKGEVQKYKQRLREAQAELSKVRGRIRGAELSKVRGRAEQGAELSKVRGRAEQGEGPRTRGRAEQGEGPRTRGRAEQGEGPRTRGRAEQGEGPRTRGRAEQGEGPRTRGRAEQGEGPRTRGRAEQGEGPRTRGRAEQGEGPRTRGRAEQGEKLILFILARAVKGSSLLQSQSSMELDVKEETASPLTPSTSSDIMVKAEPEPSPATPTSTGPVVKAEPGADSEAGSREEEKDRDRDKAATSRAGGGAVKEERERAGSSSQSEDTGPERCAVIGGVKRKEVEQLKIVRAELKKAQESQREMKLLLDMYRSAPKEQRDKVQLMAAERKAKSEAEELRQRLRELEERERREGKKMADEEALRKIRSVEEQIDTLNKKLSLAKQEEEALLSEMDVTGQAFEDMQEQNIRLMQQLREKDDANFKLMSERIKSNQIHKLLKEEKEELADQLLTLKTQVDAQLQVVRKLEEKERLLQGTISTAERELALRTQALEMNKRKAVESVQLSEELRSQMESVQSRLSAVREEVIENSISREKESFNARRAQEDISKLRRKLEKAKKPENIPNCDEILNEEIARLTCPCCNSRVKDAVLTKCFHVFCFECVKTRYDTRQRKCPKCNAAFGANDFHRIYIG